jgi:hypothetical protein
MRSNPNIIANAMLPQPVQLPDVNAMMQTQTAGMENIYAIEQQRAEQAQAAQKEQQDAAMKAVAPAVASAFSDPSDAGLDAALALVPPEYQSAAKAQLDQLRAIPDIGKRKTVIRAALARDEYGRAILQQVEPSASAQLQAGIQQGQLALAQRRLAMEEGQIGVPKPMSAYEEAQIGFREREVALKEEEAAAKAAAGEAGGIDPKTKVKLEQAYPKAARGLQSAVTGIDQDIADVEKLIADPGLKSISGLYGASTPNISPEARRAQALYDKILAGAGFGALQAMRDAAPTGGALGNVSNQEGAKLEKSVAAFAQSQDYDDLRNALRDYLFDLKVAKENVVSAFDETYSYRGPGASSDIVSGVQERRARLQPQTTEPGRVSLPPGVVVRKNP